MYHPLFRAPFSRRFMVAMSLVGGSIFFQSCQSTAPDADSGSTGDKRRVEIAQSKSLHPDSVVVRRQDSTVSHLEATSTERGVQLEFEIPADLGSDTLWLDVWVAGMKSNSVGYARSGGKVSLVAQSRNPLLVTLGKRLDSLESIGQAPEGTRSEQLLSLLGRSIVAGDSAVRGWSAHAPEGMSVGAVDSIALRLVVDSGYSAEVLGDSGWVTIPQDTIRKVLERWFEGGTISAEALKTALTPALVLADTIPPRLDRVLPESDTPELGFDEDSLLVEVSAWDTTGIDSVRIGERSVLRGSPWRLNVYVERGSDTIHVTAWDKAGHSARLLIVVHRATQRPDTLPPVVRILDPESTLVVLHKVDQYVVRWTATDSNGIDSVRDGSRVVSDGLDTVRLAEGPNRIVISAWDRAGNVGRDSVTVIRLGVGDTSAPSMRRTGNTPRRDTTVSWTVDSLSLSWIVRDDSAMGEVSLNGRKLSSHDDTVYSTKVSLAVGENTLALSTRDAAGNVGVDTLRVVRSRDSVAPEIGFETPSNDHHVIYPVSQIVVGWHAQDDQRLDSVRFQGKRTSSTSDTVSLRVGENLFVLEAWDGAGHHSTDTLRVVREPDAGDTIAPKGSRAGSITSDTTLAWKTTSVSISWKVFDETRLSMVQIDGSEVSGTDSVYTRTVSLPVGPKSIVLVARDSTGNEWTDSFTVTRLADTSEPWIRVTPSGDSTVAWEVSRWVFSLSYGDDGRVDSVKQGGRKIHGETDTVSLSVGENLIRYQVWDGAGKTQWQERLLTRLPYLGDVIPPKIVNLSPSQDTTVSWSTVELVLNYKVTDDSILDEVTLNGSPLTSTTSVFSSKVTLALGTNVFVLKAADRHGNEMTDTLRVQRKADETPPVVRRSAPSRDTVVSWAVKSQKIRWTVTDDSLLALVEIDGSEAAGVAGAYTLVKPLSVGRNLVRLLARDGHGNETLDSVVITRRADTVAPTIVRVQPKADTTVSWNVLSYAVKWTVSDDFALRSVLIDSVASTGVSGTYGVTKALVDGSNVVRIVATDSSGNVRRDSVVISRKKDAVPPTSARLNPTKDTTVAWEVSSFTAKWTVADDLALKSVEIAGAAAVSASDVYSRAVPLVVGRNVIRLIATDSSDNVRRDSVVITRQADTVAPVVTAVSPSQDTSVAWNASSLVVSWTVTDDKSLASVTIDGVAKTSTTGTYVVTKTLANGRNVVKIVATDASGNETEDSLVITRVADVVAPVVTAVSPSSDTTVAWNTSSLPISWTVTDDKALASVTIDGVAKTSTTGTYGVTKTLVNGRNVVKIVATDASGNETEDSLVITRLADVVAPVVTAVSPSSDTTVAWNVSSLPVSWTVSDDKALASVTIDGVAKTSTTGTYEVTKTLVNGRNVVKIVATDASGNETEDSLVITRVADVVAPVVTAVSPSSDTTVVWNTSSLPVSWTVSDDKALASVTIDGVAKTSTTGTFGVTKTLVNGRNVVKIVATDASGNETEDSLVITRPADALAPEVVRVAPTGSIAVPWTTTSYATEWSVTDNDAVASVTINGTAVTGVGDAYSRDLTLVVGANKVKIVAIDATGNETADSVTITRAADAVAPVVTKNVDMPGTILPVETTTFTAIWNVSDNDALASVTIDGVAVVPDAGVAKADVTLSGDAPVIRVVATDRTGNVTRDSVSIVRLKPPTLSVGAGGYSTSQTITLTSSQGASLEYALGAGSWVAYSTPLAVSTNTVLRSRAKLGGVYSSEQKSAYAFPPRFNPDGFDHTYTDSIAILASGMDSITYSTDGLTWIRYTRRVFVSETQTIQAKVWLSGISSPIAQATFKVTPMRAFSEVGYQWSAGPNGSFSPSAASVYWLKGDSLWVSGSRSSTDSGRRTYLGVGYQSVVASAGSPRITGASAFFLKSNGELSSMGSNQTGMLGDGTTTSRTTPFVVANGVQKVSAGIATTMYITAGGALYAMGSNNNGVMGIGTTQWDPATYSPTLVKSSGVIDVVVGDNTSTILMDDGSVWIAGSREYSPSATTATGIDSVHRKVTGLPPIAHIVGNAWLTFAVGRDGSLWRWGRCSYGELGTGLESDELKLPARLPGTWDTVAVGERHVLLLDAQGNVYAMGNGSMGALGTGTTTNEASPVLVSSSGAEWISAGATVSFWGKARWSGVTFTGTNWVSTRANAVLPIGWTGQKYSRSISVSD
ncbi:MAG: hypothetical protein H6686_07045 [Fibrobacteria bacterium]|nr:hypothetical protein [Fibrobacteria bacterium]